MKLITLLITLMLLLTPVVLADNLQNVTVRGFLNVGTTNLTTDQIAQGSINKYYTSTQMLSDVINTTIARTGNCGVGTVVQNITTSGVQCVTDQTGGGGFTNGSDITVNQLNITTSIIFNGGDGSDMRTLDVTANTTPFMNEKGLGIGILASSITTNDSVDTYGGNLVVDAGRYQEVDGAVNYQGIGGLAEVSGGYVTRVDNATNNFIMGGLGKVTGGQAVETSTGYIANPGVIYTEGGIVSKDGTTQGGNVEINGGTSTNGPTGNLIILATNATINGERICTETNGLCGTGSGGLLTVNSLNNGISSVQNTTLVNLTLNMSYVLANAQVLNDSVAIASINNLSNSSIASLMGNTTIARTGSATCGVGLVTQNVSITTSGVTLQCVTDQTGGAGGLSTVNSLNNGITVAQNTTLVNLTLNMTYVLANAQALNDSLAISSINNLSNSSIASLMGNTTIARTANCAAGTVAQNTTTSGVQCLAVVTGNIFNQVLNTTSNVSFYKANITELYLALNPNGGAFKNQYIYFANDTYSKALTIRTMQSGTNGYFTLFQNLSGTEDYASLDAGLITGNRGLNAGYGGGNITLAGGYLFVGGGLLTNSDLYITPTGDIQGNGTINITSATGNSAVKGLNTSATQCDATTGKTIYNSTSGRMECYTDQTGGAGGNPFNQVLNTTSNVTFANINISAGGGIFGAGGSVGGVNASIQYNNNGTMAGTPLGGAYITGEGLLNTGNISSVPVTPLSGITLSGKIRGGETVFMTVGPAGIEKTYMPHMGEEYAVWCQPAGTMTSTTAPICVGTTLTTTVGTVGNPAKTFNTVRASMTFTTITASTTVYSEMKPTTVGTNFGRGNASMPEELQTGGFKFVATYYFGTLTAASTAGGVGMTSLAATAFTNTSNWFVSTGSVNNVFVGFNKTDQGLSYYASNATAVPSTLYTCNSTHYNVTNPVHVFRTTIFAKPSAGNISFFTQRVDNSSIPPCSFVINGNDPRLPVFTVPLTWRLWMGSNGALPTANVFGFNKVFVSTDN